MTREHNADIDLLGRIACALEEVEQAPASGFQALVRAGLAESLAAHDFLSAQTLLDRAERRARELGGSELDNPLHLFLQVEQRELTKLRNIRQVRLEETVEELDAWEATVTPDPTKVGEVRARIAEQLALLGARSEASDWFRSAGECVAPVDTDWARSLFSRADAEASWVPYLRELHHLSVFRVPRAGFEPDTPPGIDRFFGPDSRS